MPNFINYYYYSQFIYVNYYLEILLKLFDLQMAACFFYI